MAVTVTSTVRTDIIVLIAATVCQFFTNPAKSSTGLFTPAFINEYNATVFEVAWIGSVQRGATASLALPAIAVMEYFGAGRPLIIMSLMMCGSFLASAYSTNVWVTVVLYGVSGVCLSTFSVAGKAFVSIYFQKYRQLAYSTVVLGASVGGVTITYGVAEILNAFGLKEALYFLSSLALPLLLFAFVFYYYCPFKSCKSKEDEIWRLKEYSYLEQALGHFRFIAVASVKQNADTDDHGRIKDLFLYSHIEGLECCDHSKIYEEEQKSERDSSILRDSRLYVFMVSRVLTTIGQGIVDLLTTDMLLVVFGVSSSNASYFIVVGMVGNMVGRIGAIPLCFVKFSRLFSYVILCSIQGALVIAFPHTNFMAVCIMGAIHYTMLGYQTSANGQIPIDIFGSKQAHRLIALASTASGVGFIIGAPIAGILQAEFGYISSYLFAGCSFLAVAILTAILNFHPKTRAIQKVQALKEKQRRNEKLSPQIENPTSELVKSTSELVKYTSDLEKTSIELEKSTSEFEKSVSALFEKSSFEQEENTPELEKSTPELGTPMAEFEKSMTEFAKSLSENEKSIAEHEKYTSELLKSLSDREKPLPEHEKSLSVLEKSPSVLEKSLSEHEKSVSEHETSTAELREIYV